MRDGDVTVVDVRPPEEYEAGHIPGALSVPVAELKRRLREIPKGREVIAYCRGRYCVYSLEAVTLLRKQGTGRGAPTKACPIGRPLGCRWRSAHDSSPVSSHRSGHRRILPRRLRRQEACVVVDPVDDARALSPRGGGPRMAIRYVVDTHVHADHLSTGRALAGSRRRVLRPARERQRAVRLRARGGRRARSRSGMCSSRCCTFPATRPSTSDFSSPIARAGRALARSSPATR